MKKLTKIRLINWHYFANETIHVKNHTLITGQNATGKSTIVDAIAFVLTAGDQIFNIAANEKSKRDLRGYVKCKLGTDNQEYLRENDTTGHVALEFYDEKKDNYFTIGTVIDVFGEILAPKVIFYEYDDKMTDGLFIDEDGKILTTVNFKKTKQAKRVFLTRREAKLAFRSSFGSVNENYFSLLPKALAFKPIPDVKDFIYRYLLEEKELDVESIKESIHAYRDLEATLKIIKSKVNDLEEIKHLYEEIKNNQDQKQFYEYFLKMLEIETLKSKIDAINKKQEKIQISKEQNQILINEINAQLDILDERSKEIYSMLKNNDSFKANEIYDKEINELTKRIDQQVELRNYAVTKAKKMKQIINELKNEYNNKIYNDLSKIDLDKIDDTNYEDQKLKLISINKNLSEIEDENKLNLGRYHQLRDDLVREINDVYLTLKDLDNNQLRYNPMIKKLQSKIEEGVLKRFGKEIKVHILCELLEITNSEWANTIEDYLGQQRFNLIVEPRYFDEALNVYNQIKDTLNIYGIGLVNTKKIQHFTNFRDNSLASIITSENIDATHYINMTCGNLIMVDDVQDLEKYPQAITKSGMVYRSYTVRSLYNKTEKPFIGKKARTQQLENWREKAKELKDKHQEISNQIQSYSEENSALQALGLESFISMLKTFYSLDSLKEKRKALAMKKKNVPQQDLSELREEYEAVKEEIRNFNINRQKAYQKQGKFDSDELKTHEELLEVESTIKRLETELAKNDNLVAKKEARELYYLETKKNNNISNIFEEYQDKIQSELNNIINLEDSLKSKQINYTSKYNLSYKYGITYIQEYLDELDKLVKSELVKYESKVREARETAERLFKEDFLAKLRNYIVSAQEEISKINETLKLIHFGDDTYEFIFPKSKEYGDYYDMVLSDESLKTGEEIFNYDFERKYQRQLEELFINLASEDLNSQGTVNKFTDYRTYMDYDIAISNNSGDRYLYSKVFKEKSGGETQVPFYVATLASFVRVFEQASRGINHDSIGLILFDEVFDKMDTTRIKAMMKFIRELPVQILLATPPQKMEVLSKYTDTTIVTLRDGKAARAYEVIKSDI
ncbi:MAG: SbcC/MukB-like Walker B domain-containing protein [Candidatus Izemoplasmatales bacterium]|nr:SbcC/MukB-like Walker B domain-containing protein [Candidatus Izemoplasmatales bacterium]